MSSSLNLQSFLGRILDSNKQPTGTCFQVSEGILVTAAHVVKEAALADDRLTVWVSPMRPTSEPMRGTVIRADEAHDLAIIKLDGRLAESVPFLAYSDAQPSGTKFTLTGYGILPEPGRYDAFNYMTAPGKWEGKAETVDGIARARGAATATAKGMSGCPVIRDIDQAVIGILSGRYKSLDAGYSRDRIWIARVENLVVLLEGIAEVPIDRTGGPTLVDQSTWLLETPLNLDRLRRDETFIQASEWSKAWEQVGSALQSAGVIVVVAPPGVGATTFAEHALARLTAINSASRLDPGDWAEPAATVIPRLVRRGAILDLRDPDHDRPSEQFLQGLEGVASRNLAFQSRLVITVREDLWPGVAAKPIEGLREIYIDTSPDAVEIVRKNLQIRVPELVPLLSDAAVSRHLVGRNAVQATIALEKIFRAWNANGAVPAGSRAAVTAAMIAEVLDDHVRELDALFGDLEAPASRADSLKPAAVAPLPISDRCLLIALACRRKVALAQLEKDAEELEAELLGGRRETQRSDPHALFARAGLSGRLQRVQATRGTGDTVMLGRVGFAEAVIQYVWDNYPAVRPPLTRWLIDFARESGEHHAAVIEWITKVLRRRQDIDFLKGDLLRISKTKKNLTVLSGVLANAVKDEHMQRRCERLLYDWAIQADLHEVVVDVALGMLRGERQELALRRLQRVADAGVASRAVLDKILGSFLELISEPVGRQSFRKIVYPWFSKFPDSVSAKLAFAAALEVYEENGRPWLLTAEADTPEVNRMLSNTLVDPESRDAVVRLIQRSCTEDEFYSKILGRVAQAVIRNGEMLPIIKLANQFSEVGRETGRNPMEDLLSRLRPTSSPDSRT